MCTHPAAVHIRTWGTSRRKTWNHSLSDPSIHAFDTSESRARTLHTSGAQCSATVTRSMSELNDSSRLSLSRENPPWSSRTLRRQAAGRGSAVRPRCKTARRRSAEDGAHMRYAATLLGSIAPLFSAADALAQNALASASRDAQRLADCTKALDAACPAPLYDARSYELLNRQLQNRFSAELNAKEVPRPSWPDVGRVVEQ